MATTLSLPIVSDNDLVCLADKVQEIVCHSLQKVKFLTNENPSKSDNSAKQLLAQVEEGEFKNAYKLLISLVEKNSLSDIVFLCLALTTFRLKYFRVAERYAAQAVELYKILGDGENLDIIKAFANSLRQKVEYEENSKMIVNDRFVHLYPTKDQLKELNAVDKYIMEGLSPAKPFITKSDQITTIGSCFTGNISTFLRHNGFDVPILKDEYTGNVPTASFSDEVFNTFILRHLFELLFENKNDDNDTYEVVNQHNQKMSFSLERTRASFKSSKIFIITLGLSEVWYNKKNGEVYKTAKSVGEYDEELHDFRVTTVRENVDNLNYVIQSIRKNNKNASIIFTLSPVPLKATFRNMSCTVANSVSKAILRVALDEIFNKYTKDKNLYYFPSYELILDCLPNPFEQDRRYISSDTVKFTMTLFAKHYVMHSKDSIIANS